MTDAEIEALALGLPDVSKRYAFNGEGFYVRARLFAFFEPARPAEPGGLVLRLPDEPRAEVLQVAGSRLWTMPRTSERRTWVFVPAESLDAETLARWLASACEHALAGGG
jgi:hypothetical protein